MVHKDEREETEREGHSEITERGREMIQTQMSQMRSS